MAPASASSAQAVQLGQASYCRRSWRSKSLPTSRPPAYEAPVRVSFAMPYRCEFGQNLCLIGSTLDLGGWDTQRCVNMQWTDGDVWKVELEIRASSSSGTEMEYKYAVRNRDGNIATWKPGENFSLRIPLDEQLAVLPERVRICDAWDNSYRKMEVELGNAARLAAGQEPNAEVQMTAALTLEAEEALAELKTVIETSSALMATISPSSPEALAADRAVAAAEQKLHRLTKALNDVKIKGQLKDGA